MPGGNAKFSIAEVHSEPRQISKMEPFAKIVNDLKVLTIFKSSIVDAWQGSRYVSEVFHWSFWIVFLTITDNFWKLVKDTHRRAFNWSGFVVSVCSIVLFHTICIYIHMMNGVKKLWNTCFYQNTFLSS